MVLPTLSPEHYVAWRSTKIGPFVKAMEVLKNEPAKREAYIKDIQALIEEYMVDNVIRHEYLLTRAIKV